jgi:hypothetical protein
MAKVKPNDVLFQELMTRQLDGIHIDKRLRYSDLKRICKYVDVSIFDPTQCCMWTGYVTNAGNASKGTYINFYFRGKKVALHRLLYSNFVEELTDDEYLKFSCENKGKCCNIDHLKKFKYRNPSDTVPKRKEVKKKKGVTIFSKDMASEADYDDLYISFD